MNDRKTRLPELIMARLSLGAAPVDGTYWFERQSTPWIDRGTKRERQRADPRVDRRPRYTDTD